ncbi:hypothetical protein GQX73_g8073 [Xylaria multiplex]|uniref:Alcohol dehydrogenase-like C-terminal domain-containing protein n=1 Tax=Xylaria multiplex TaxID=323545 RepID=A0A7C8MQ28_9PEZI|nr:hypothetical protein GQX73_g8073 [Xylaria multiplex]
MMGLLGLDNTDSGARILNVYDGWVLVKVKAVALNPTDWKHVEWDAITLASSRKSETMLQILRRAIVSRVGFTARQGMYNRLKLPLPTELAKEPFPVLIYGGSTATGMAGIQFAKLSGLTVITTCSPHSFDYKSPTCATDIKKLTNNSLKYSWNCTGDSAAICAVAMSDSEEGIYGTIMPSELELLKRTILRLLAKILLAAMIQWVSGIVGSGGHL